MFSNKDSRKQGRQTRQKSRLIIIAVILVIVSSLSLEICRTINSLNKKTVNLEEIQKEKARIQIKNSFSLLNDISKTRENKISKASKVSIEFDNITTSESTFKELESSCDEKVKQYKTKNNKNSVSDRDTDKSRVASGITKDAFIDNKENLAISNDTSMKKADIIYMQDKILVLYTNECGDMQILGATIKNTDTNSLISSTLLKYNLDNKEDIEVLAENDLKNIFDKFKSSILLGRYSIKASNIEVTNEKDYLQQLGDIINSIMIGNNLEINKKYISDYFDSDLENHLFNVLDGKYIEFISAGKSDLSLEYKDRIIIQINKNDKDYTTIILKLNNEIVYDIDIL